jgi:hypothetical protein
MRAVSSYFKPIRKLQDKTSPAFMRKWNNQVDIGRQLNPDLPKMEVPEIPAAPTIDTAQQDRSQQDRIRRRRGVLANIYGGATGAGGSGKAQLGA